MGVSIANGVTATDPTRGASTVIGAQTALGIGPGITINALGDSISALSTYQPVTLPSYAASQQWLANTVYASGNVVVNNGLYYRCTTGGTSAASGGPTGVATSVADNTVTWRYMPPQGIQNDRCYLSWACREALGKLVWDMSSGYAGSYGGVTKALIASGGTLYSSSDTATLTNGAKATLTVSGGVITAVTITDPGYTVTGNTAITINTSTGSGAVIALVQSGCGKFASPGWTTQMMVAALPDITASAVDIIAVHGGTNDVANSVAHATTIANLKLCYETILNAGKHVIAVPILPRDSSLTTAPQRLLLQRVNQWIRDYVAQQSYANPLRGRIVLADAYRYLVDGTPSALGSPIGAAAAAAGAMTVDGVHPSPRGARYIGRALRKAAESFIGAIPDTSYCPADATDGYQVANNPSGNILEGSPWAAATAYVVGDHVTNDTAPVKVYVCDTAGTSAGSGGPTGTGSNITDGTARWDYLQSSGLGNMAVTFDVTPTAAAGIVYTGSAPHNTVFGRLSGTGTGTVILAQESPWSDGQVGLREAISYSIGSGSNTEQWQHYVNHFGAANLGIEASAFGVDYFYVLAELQVSGVANLTQLVLQLGDNFSNSGTFDTAVGLNVVQGSGTNYGLPSSSGEMLDFFNGEKLLYRSQPMQIPTNNTNPFLVIRPCFNAAGGADSATATIKINYWGIFKAYQS